MQVTETLSEGLKREFKVVVPASDLEAQIESRLEELSKTVRMKGFRPGKVPMSIVRRQYRQSVLGEVLQQTIETSTRETIQERELRPALQPTIDIGSFDDGEDLEFTMGLELLPAIELGDLSDLALTRLKADVADDAVDDALGRIAEQNRRFEAPSEPREAAEGDQLLIDFAGEIDGEPIEHGEAEDFELELGSAGFIPGFEDQLIGAKPGEDRTLKVTFPEDYPAENLAGKEATFKVAVKEVRERVEVPIDDELAKAQGLDDLAALKDSIREQLGHHYDRASQARLKRALLDVLDERYRFDVPPGMVEQEFEGIWGQIEADAERTETPLTEVLDKPEEEAREEYRGIAERRVRLGLLLSEVGNQNDITVDREDLLKAALESAQGHPNPQQILDFYRSQPDALERFRAPVYEDKVVAFLVEMATVSDEVVPLEELLRDPDEEEDNGADEASAEAGVEGDTDAKDKKGA